MIDTIKLILAFLSVICALEAHGCEDKNNLEASPPYLKIPRDQMSTQWCYAFTTADLISQKVGRNISALHIGAVYNNAIDNNFFGKLYRDITGNITGDLYNGGWMSEAVAQVSDKDICIKEPVNLALKKSDENSEKLVLLSSLVNNLLEDKEYFLDYYQKLIKLGVARCENRIYQDTFPNVTLGEILAALNTYTQNESRLVLQNLLELNCNEKIKLPKLTTVKRFSPSYHSNDSQEDKVSFLADLNGQIDKGKFVGMNYTLKGITKEGGEIDFHASSIVGRKMINNKCHYMIKNSWGKSCSNFKQTIPCNSLDGTFFLEEEMLVNSAMNITWIK